MDLTSPVRYLHLNDARVHVEKSSLGRSRRSNWKVPSVRKRTQIGGKSLEPLLLYRNEKPVRKTARQARYEIPSRSRPLSDIIDDALDEPAMILPNVPTSREEDSSTVSCGLGYLGCSYGDASWDRDDWLSHIIDHFKDIPNLSDAKCHICEEEFDTPTDTHIKNIWSDRLGHCWQHIQERALAKDDLSLFFKSGRLLSSNGTYQIFRHAYLDPYGSGQIFKNLITLENGQIYCSNSDFRKPWYEANRKMNTSSPAAKVDPEIRASFPHVDLASQMNTNFSDLVLPLRKAHHSGQTQGGHQGLFDGETENLDGDLIALSATDTNLHNSGHALMTMDDHNAGEIVVNRESLDGANLETSALSPVSQPSARASMAETTSSQWEEETDWDGESSFGSALDQTSLQSLSFIDDEHRSSPLQHQFTSAQRILIERLMSEFWIIFDHRWQAQTQQRGQTSTSPQHTQSQSIEEHKPSGSNWTKPTSTKRPRSDDNEDSDNERDQPPKRNGKEREFVDPSEVPVRYACPYRKHNPKKYSIQAWRICALTPHTSVARIKAHLYKYHLIHQCPRCKQLFKDPSILKTHTLVPESCAVQEADPVDGITSETREQLQSRKKAFPGQTEADRWDRLYKVIFRPEIDDEIPSPYFEPIQDSELHPSLSPESQAFMEYEGHFRRELPRHFRQIIEIAVSREMQRQFMDYLEEAQKRTFSSFREKFQDQKGSSGDENKATDLKSDDGQPEKDPESATMLETFFDPPPPAAETELVSLPLLNQSSRHIGAENWSDEKDCFHDSAYASSSTQLAIGRDMGEPRWNAGQLSSQNGESSSLVISAPRSDQENDMKYRNVETLNHGAPLFSYGTEPFVTGPDLINELASMGDSSWALNFDNIDIEHTFPQ